MRSFVTAFFVICAGVLPSTGASAAEWSREASIEVGSFYSTNICLSPHDEQGEAAGTAKPSGSVRADGERVDFALRGAVEYNSVGELGLECPGGGLGNIANRESWVPQGTAFAEVEAVEDFLFLEVDAFAAQNPVNPFAPGGADNLNAAGNTNVTYRWGAGARVDRRYGESWGIFLRYNYNEQYNTFDRLLGDSQEDRVEFDVGMLPEASRFSVGLSGSYSQIAVSEIAGRPEFTDRLARAEARAALNLSRRWQVNGFVGQEDNTVSLSVQDEIDGEVWDVGARFQPNERTTLEAGYGERFFGSTPRLAIDYRHRRTNLKISYDRDLQFQRDLRGGGGVFDPDDPLDPGLGDPGAPLSGDGAPTFVGQGPLFNERFTMAYRFDARRTTLSLRAADSRQTRVVDNRGGRFRSGSVTLTRRVGPATTLDLGLAYTSNQGDLGFGVVGGEFEQGLEAWRGSLGLRRQLTRRTLFILRYDYTEQEGAGPAVPAAGNVGTAHEHRVSLGLRFDLAGDGPRSSPGGR